MITKYPSVFELCLQDPLIFTVKTSDPIKISMGSFRNSVSRIKKTPIQEVPKYFFKKYYRESNVMKISIFTHLVLYKSTSMKF